MVAWQWYKYQRNGNTIRIINKINGQQGNWREAGVKRRYVVETRATRGIT